MLMKHVLPYAAAMAAVALSASAGEVSGKVTLKGTPPPEKPIAALKADPNCGKANAAAEVKTRLYVVGADSGLANTLVYIKKGLEGKTFAPSAEKPLIDQKGCMYEPYINAVQAGQQFDVKNSDAFMHNVNATPKAAGNKGFNFAQANAGQVNTKVFDKPELGVRFACNVHPWMIAYLHVLENPFFAVTDKDGNYTFKGDLPDGKYTVEAFHMKAGAVTQEIEVKGGKATAAFILEVRAQ